DCMAAIFSLASLPKWHSSMEQVANESGQPHWQAMRAPTRRTSKLGFCDAVCAAAANATRASSKLLLNGFLNSMFPGNTYDFGARVLHLHFAWNQADESARDQ